MTRTTRLIDEMVLNLELNGLLRDPQRSFAKAILRQVLDVAWSDSQTDRRREPDHEAERTPGATS